MKTYDKISFFQYYGVFKRGKVFYDKKFKHERLAFFCHLYQGTSSMKTYDKTSLFTVMGSLNMVFYDKSSSVKNWPLTQ